MDLVTGGVLALAGIAVAAILTAWHYAREVSWLQDVTAAAYQLSGALDDDFFVDEDRGRLVGYERNVAAELLLDVLADPDGAEARCLVDAPAGTAYSAIAARAAQQRGEVPAFAA